MDKKLTLTIKRFDKSIPLPEKKTAGAVAFDLAARLTVEVPAKSIAKIPLNVAIKPPEGYWLLMAPRSSTHKLGIMQANNVGIFDEDFCGDGDEYVFLAYNFTQRPVTVEKGTRIAQLVLLPHIEVTVCEVEKMDQADRGGIGTTGK